MRGKDVRIACVGRRSVCGALLAALLTIMATAPAKSRAQAGSQTPAPKTPPAVGTIKEISGNSLTLATDAGSELNVILPPDVKLLRVPPGSKDLKEAAPMQMSDLKGGDRILVRGEMGDDGKTFTAATVVAMKKEELAEKAAHEKEEWLRHGIGGLVKSVDAANGAVTIGVVSAAGSREVAVHTTKSTLVRRYAPDSVKFDDARISSLAAVKVGDQLRARGMRSADGAEFTADEIVSGTFRNIAGTILAVDAKAGMMNVSDLATRKPLEVRFTSESEVRKLPLPMAQRIAARLKGVSPDASQTGGAAATGPPSTTPPAGGAGQGATGGPGGTPGGRGGGDLQQMLTRLPATTLSDFQKGDAVVIVATSGQSDSQPTVITLLGGVEPILEATPQGQAASILTPWSLSTGGGGSDSGTP
jgi:hypothetical protein